MRKVWKFMLMLTLQETGIKMKHMIEIQPDLTMGIS